jgi:hypothetical protein
MVEVREVCEVRGYGGGSVCVTKSGMGRVY